MPKDKPIYDFADDGAITADTFIEIGGMEDLVLSVMCEWTNTAANVVFTVESTNKPPRESDIDSTVLSDWVPETSVVFEGTAPAGSAVGAQLAHIGNSGARRLRLKVTHTADADLLVWIHGKKGGR